MPAITQSGRLTLAQCGEIVRNDAGSWQESLINLLATCNLAATEFVGTM
jgi:hypothetical protein